MTLHVSACSGLTSRLLGYVTMPATGVFALPIRGRPMSSTAGQIRSEHNTRGRREIEPLLQQTAPVTPQRLKEDVNMMYPIAGPTSGKRIPVARPKRQDEWLRTLPRASKNPSLRAGVARRRRIKKKEKHLTTKCLVALWASSARWLRDEPFDERSAQNATSVHFFELPDGCGSHLMGAQLG